jgi:formate hydrogenlyase subunit 4
MRTGWPPASMAAVSLLQVVGVLVGGPLLVGLMRAVRCRLEGRTGPPVRQPLLDLRKLARRERTTSDETSWVFPMAPLVLVGSTVVVAAIAPLLATDPAYGWSTDLFAVVFLLLLGSVALALGALDSGTAFGGMGASRAMTIGALSEPALLVAILALSVPARSSNLPAIVTGSLAHPLWLATPERLLALVAFVIVIVAESGRLPVDNPSTHLELTMIHEAMVLEYSGTDLALIKLGESMRLAVLIALFADLFVPWGIATAPGPIHLLVGLATTVGKVAALGVGLAVFEVAVAKLRLFRVPELLAGAFVLSVLAVLSALVVA